MQISRVSGWLGIAFSLFEPSGIYNLGKIDRLKIENRTLKYRIETGKQIPDKRDQNRERHIRKYEISLFGFVTLSGERSTPTG